MPLQRIARMAVLLAAALVLYRFSVHVPLFPTFLKYDASEVPVVVGALAYGPGAGLLLEVMKNLLHGLMKGGANPVGLAANFCAGALLLIGLVPMYGLAQRTGWRWTGVVSGAIAMGIGMIPLNYAFFLPAHGMTSAALLHMAITMLTPFNMTKAAITGIVGIVLYERLDQALGGSLARSAR